MDMKKLKEELKEYVEESGYDEGEIYVKKKEILNAFIEEKIAEGELPEDFDCSYFELHDLYRVFDKY